jgi:hypothetical protein
MGISNEKIMPAMADHRSMCRFSDPSSQRYRPVEQAVLDLVDIARVGTSTSITSPSENLISPLPSFLRVVLTTVVFR